MTAPPRSPGRLVEKVLLPRRDVAQHLGELVLRASLSSLARFAALLPGFAGLALLTGPTLLARLALLPALALLTLRPGLLPARWPPRWPRCPCCPDWPCCPCWPAWRPPPAHRRRPAAGRLSPPSPGLAILLATGLALAVLVPSCSPWPRAVGVLQAAVDRVALALHDLVRAAS